MALITLDCLLVIVSWLVVLQSVTLLCEVIEGNFSNRVYCVNREESKHSNDCLRLDDANGCCGSLSLLVSQLYENTSIPTQITIEIYSNLFLNETVSFESFDGVEIVGINDSSVFCANGSGEMNAGLYFKDTKNILMKNLAFVQCGSLQNYSIAKDFNFFHSSLHFINCSNLTLENMIIKDGYGTGAILFNVFGMVMVSHSVFDSNTVRNPKTYSGGGGLIMVMNNSSSGKSVQRSTSIDEYMNNNYTIQNYSFCNNHASSLKHTGIYIHSNDVFHGFGRGGGLAIYLDGDMKWSTVKIMKCIFHSNSAYLGGGLFIMFRGDLSNNSVTVEDSEFITNHAKAFTPLSDDNNNIKRTKIQKLLQKKGGGGGGAGGGFLLNKKNHDLVGNSLIFKNCLFESNHAEGNGGGISIFSTRMISSDEAKSNSIALIDCNIQNNSAYVASAVDISPEVFDRLGYGTLPTPVIKNCHFVSNIILNKDLLNSEQVNTSLNGIATVFISTFLVQFYGHITFMQNKETALHLSAASVRLTNGSSLYFVENHGKNGGAVSMIARSVLYIGEDCDLQFINNSAVAKGGAFYVYSIDHQHEIQFSHSCFIQYYYQERNVPRISNRNITFKFKNNSALTGIGDVLYATSLLPCTYDKHSPSEVFEIVGSVDHQIERKDGYNLSTLAYNFKFDNQTLENMQHLIPGVQFNMKINAMDELRQTQNTTYYAHMGATNNISVDPAYTQVSNNSIKLYGTNTESFVPLILEPKIATISIEIRLGECPPGFMMEDDICVCAASKIFGIARCKRSSSHSYIFRGYWIGICNSGNSLCSAHCPKGYCYQKFNHHDSEEFLLPSDIKEIDGFICGPYRTGILCGKCIENSSVQYHSHAYSCKPNKYCNLGVLFYLISEILPLIIFFLVVIIFNISFTSGALNGFILFAQMSDTIDLNAGDTIDLHQHVRFATYPYKLIYRMFNFDFFSLDTLSFCLWRHATTMDALIMKFVTITFALLLIVLIIFIFNTWKFRVWCHWFRPRTLKAAFTHGLSTLFIVSFSQCARVSFFILSGTRLNVGLQHTISVVFYSGNLQPFVGDHLKYAIPAVFYLFFLVIVPLLWLLSYPLLFKFLGICHMSESRFSVYLSRLFPVELLDSFQSCFKENHRYFAGLYLLYRFMPLVIFANMHRLLQTHVVLAVQFLIMFTLHSVVHPYKSNYHNRIDSFILANLSLVNILTTYNYALFSTGDQSVYRYTVHWIMYLHLLLMYCPLIYLLYYCAAAVYYRMKMKCKGYFTISSEDDTDLLPPLRDF